MEFNTHGLSQSMLDDVAKILGDMNQSFPIPECLVEAAKKAAKDYPKMQTLEDRANHMRDFFETAINENKLTPDTHMMFEFEQAVKRFIS
jgi:hypothetical protein